MRTCACSAAPLRCRLARPTATANDLPPLRPRSAKFTRECPGLLDRALNPREVDLIFVKVKSRAKWVGVRRQCRASGAATVARAARASPPDRFFTGAAPPPP